MPTLRRVRKEGGEQLTAIDWIIVGIEGCPARSPPSRAVY